MESERAKREGKQKKKCPRFLHEGKLKKERAKHQKKAKCKISAVREGSVHIAPNDATCKK